MYVLVSFALSTSVILIILIIVFLLQSQPKSLPPKSSPKLPVVVSYPLTCYDAELDYLKKYPDIKSANIDPWGHYQAYGKTEKRTWNGASCKFVTILYSVWVDHMMQNNQPIYFQDNPGPGYNWWGKPLYKNGDVSKYKFIDNNDLIDYHADLLVTLGIDFISIDLSNGEQPKIIEAAHRVAKRYSERTTKTPKIVLFVQNEMSVKTLQNQFYFNPQYKSGIWFEYLGRPLVLIAFTEQDTPEPDIAGFTARRCWGLLDFKCISPNKSKSSNYACADDKLLSWTFKQNTNVDGQLHLPYYSRGYPEEMSVCAATQETFMTDANSRRQGRENGKYLKQQWENVLRYNPRFVFITAWNEWGSENQGENKFVDTFGQEYNSDIEPMLNGSTDMYYQICKDYIIKFKNQ